MTSATPTRTSKRGNKLLLAAMTCLAIAYASAAEPEHQRLESLPETLEAIRSLYDDPGSTFSKLIEKASEETAKVDRQTSEEVSTNMNLFPLYQSQIHDTSQKLIEELQDLSANHDKKKDMAIQLVYLQEQVAEMNRLDSEVVLKLERGSSKGTNQVDLGLEHLVYPFTSRAFYLETILRSRIQQFITQEL